MPSILRLVQVSLLGVIVSLLLVGVVSGTPLRHVVQVTPVAIALVAVWRRNSWAIYGAIAVFLLWFTLMTFIWLFLLGIARIITGTFSPAEIALTISIGAFCLVGLASCLRTPLTSPWVSRIAAFIGFAALQVAGLWLSFQPYIARR